MDFLGEGWAVWRLIITVLIYAAILANLLIKKGDERFMFLILLAGYFAITSIFDDFFLGSTLVVLWFLFSGVKFFISRGILIALLAVMLILSYSNPLFYLGAGIVYIITITNFLFSSFRNIKMEE